jgi:hypothetical protein
MMRCMELAFYSGLNRGDMRSLRELAPDTVIRWYQERLGAALSLIAIADYLVSL